MRIVPQKTISFWLETGKKYALDAIAVALDRDRSQANAGKSASEVKLLAAFDAGAVRHRCLGSRSPISTLVIHAAHKGAEETLSPQ
jgi:hypothetical protein